MNKESRETMDNFIPKNAVKFCNQCKHRIPYTATCAAFPNGIPVEVATWRTPHDRPIPGDNGIQFEQK